MVISEFEFGIAMPNSNSLMTIYKTFLDGHFQSQGMADEIIALSEKLVKATLNVHKDVSENFRKTAANFHYEFNIRHLAGVFQGILMSSTARFKEPERVAYLWLHEIQRIYGDRLVSEENLATFAEITQANAKRSFGEFNMVKFYEDPPAPLLFAHFMDGLGEEPMYDFVPQIADLKAALEAGLEDYNESNAQMDLVRLMPHVCRITRVIMTT